uniref:Uncharacterized protein n=1 Tax=Astyanax mexicanus TaxID=7994 RepID=A0A8B9I186_ASTMX
VNTTCGSRIWQDSLQDDPDNKPAPKIQETPEDIKQEAIVNTLAFHPKEDLLAAGDIDGDIYLYRYSCTVGENKELWSSGHHLKSCRKVAFSSDGESHSGKKKSTKNDEFL